ncbi:hypothetical protein ACMU_05435 [Actibacterium mucosum KCTC 23349]|uniref:Inner membrane protein YqiJ n=1 Tax=Actibacterium mucosum KCTC 23349 TaxID=1454373 RepID=A0A037ZLI8_9RHOB|nr:OB-fold-containig protein [Actibacterium mucosum]KAJ56387.1 hypothetical protein ACMU_05435 [Actibacterium mucosum KCTC 23349]
MTDLMLDATQAPFLVALGLLFGLLALEILLSLLGLTLLGGEGDVDLELDVDAPDLGDFDISLDGADIADLELAEFEAEIPETPEPAGMASVMGLGKMPAMIWLAAVLLGFGVSGLALQSAINAAFGAALPAGLAVFPAGAAGLWFARSFGGLFARLLPKTETTAQTQHQLGRQRGVITQGNAKTGSPAEVRVIDRHGNMHYLRAEPLKPEDTIAQGTDVLVLRRRSDGRFLLVALSD